MFKLDQLAFGAILITIIIAALILLKNILVPFVLAVIFWLIVVEVRTAIGNLIGSEKHKIPMWFQNILASVAIFVFIFLEVKVLGVSMQNLSESMVKYDDNLMMIEKQINTFFNIDITSHVNKMLGDFNFTNLLRSVLSSITGLFGNTFTIILYMIFILFEEAGFNKKIRAIYSNQAEYDNAMNMIMKIGKTVSSYLTLKTMVSILTGGLSYVVLLLMGVEAPFFWSSIIIYLNFIPTIGSLIATLFPAFFTIIQFGDFSAGFIVLAAVGAIQVIVGNIVEPKIMGNTLNISGLVVLLALSFWGEIWGVWGMILSVPITVLMIIIFAEFDSTRAVAIILSENGIVETKKKEDC